jgi:hypothetical protein
LSIEIFILLFEYKDVAIFNLRRCEEGSFQAGGKDEG